MKYKIYNTPIIGLLIPYIAKFLLFLFGWKIGGAKPEVKQCVMIAAPHTSNWDFFFTVCIALALKVDASIMIKDTWVKHPFGFIFIWLGVIPIDRTKSNNVVDQSINHFKKRSSLVLIVPPSGTRSKITYWKTGFYHIAKGPNVPIILGFLDYKHKKGGVGKTVYPTGNIEVDMEEIKGFYSDITGKNPEKQLHVAAEQKN